MAERANTQLRIAVAAGLLGAAFAASDSLAKHKVEGVRCYGVAKAGENDCASASGSHDCAGKSRVDYSGAEWRDLPNTKACVELGGFLRPFMGVNSKLVDKS
ncbi:MAG: DUF2282 domain-containing protein [Kiloniellales bacterium]